MMKKRPPPKPPKEFARFKDFLRRIVAVPKKEVDEKMAEYRRRQAEGKEASEPEA
jgi:hypothetical protein